MINKAGILVLAAVLGCSVPALATGEVFPVNFAATYSDGNTNTMVKAEANELRISVGPVDGESTQDYLVDIELGTIAQSSGELASKGGEGWQEAYNSVIASLGTAHSGLASSGDTVNAEAVGSTISYLQTWAAA